MVNRLLGKATEDVHRHLLSRITHSPSILFRNTSSPLCESVMPIGLETMVVYRPRVYRGNSLPKTLDNKKTVNSDIFLT